MSNSSLAQKVMPIIGLFYVVIGVIGFTITGFGNFVQNTGDTMLGFSVNPFHNVVHFAIGAFLIVMCLGGSAPVAEGAVMGVGLFYVVAFVIGVVAPDNLTIISMTGAGDLENINHLFNGVVLLAIGLISSGATAADMKKRGLA